MLYVLETKQIIPRNDGLALLQMVICEANEADDQNSLRTNDYFIRCSGESELHSARLIRLDRVGQV
jgi:hypothetical protein